ncbi:MAG: oxidoreductase [Cytophaga sp.]|nr:oxidoreductase [Cytophaga sp.]
MKTALVAGATGLIGGQLLELLLADRYYDKVIAISRKPLELESSRLQNSVIDFAQLESAATDLKADDVYCCLGTTIKQAGSQSAFRKVDYEYPAQLARITKQNGARQYLLVSALGADPSSGIFYNRVKGETEVAIHEVGFESVHVMRPSLLMGPRKEHRSGEEAAKVFYKYLGFLIPAKYKGIESIKVARAMIALAKQNKAGYFIHESLTLQAY